MYETMCGFVVDAVINTRSGRITSVMELASATQISAMQVLAGDSVINTTSGRITSVTELASATQISAMQVLASDTYQHEVRTNHQCHGVGIDASSYIYKPLPDCQAISHLLPPTRQPNLLPT